MSKSGWPEAFGVASVAASCALILTPWERIGPIRWDAVSALATVLAVGVALFVPYWLRGEERREQVRKRHFEDSAAFSDLLKLLLRLEDAAIRMATAHAFDVLVRELQGIYDGLERLEARTSDQRGRDLTGDSADVARDLLEYAMRVAEGRGMAIEPAGAMLDQARLTRELIEDAQRWSVEIDRRGMRIGLKNQ